MWPKPSWWLGCKRAKHGKQPQHKQGYKSVNRMPIGFGSLCGSTVRWQGIAHGLLDNCVNFFATRLLLLVSHCIRLTRATRLARAMCAATVQKRTARVKPLSVVSRAAILITLIGTPRSISLGHRSWCLLSRSVVDLDAIRLARKGRDKLPSFVREFMTKSCGEPACGSFGRTCGRKASLFQPFRR